MLRRCNTIHHTLNVAVIWLGLLSLPAQAQITKLSKPVSSTPVSARLLFASAAEAQPRIPQASETQENETQGIEDNSPPSFSTADLGSVESATRADFTELDQPPETPDRSIETPVAQVSPDPEAPQFPSTQLYGQIVFGVQNRSSSSSDYVDAANNTLGRDGIPETPDPRSGTTAGYNAQLSLVTQFSERSYLLTGIQSGNLNTGVNNTLFGFNNTFTALGYELDTNNDIVISDFNYRHLLADNFAVIAGPAGVNPVSVFRGPSRVESAGFGPLSRFAQRNPILQLGGTSAGVGFDWQATPQVSLQGVYSSTLASSNPTTGLLGDTYTAGVQALVTPTETTDVALYYLHSYSGANGGFLRTGVGDDQLSANLNSRLSTHGFGATANWAITPGVTVGGWVGFTNSTEISNSGLNSGGTVQTSNWMLSLQFPDLFAKGNYGGIFFGQPPRITGSNLQVNGTLSGNIPSFFEGNGGATGGGRPDTAYHLEAFYRWRLTDNFTVTPGVILVFNSGHNNNNGTIGIGAIRTTFSF